MSLSIKTLFLFTSLIILVGTAEAKIYKWTDQNGKTHYSDKPFNEQTEELKLNHKITTKRKEEAQKQAVQLFKRQQRMLLNNNENELDNKKKVEQQKELEKACYEAKDELELLEMQVRVYELDEKGKRKFISDSERKKEIKELKQTILEYCNN